MNSFIQKHREQIERDGAEQHALAAKVAQAFRDPRDSGTGLGTQHAAAHTRNVYNSFKRF